MKSPLIIVSSSSSSSPSSPSSIFSLSLLLFLLTVLLHSTPTLSAASRGVTERTIRVKNSSASLITLFWVSVNDGSYVPQLTHDLYPSASTTINSYIGHTFAVVELADSCYLPDLVTLAGSSGRANSDPKATKKVCKEWRFTVSTSENQVISTSGDGESFLLRHVDDDSRRAAAAASSVSSCLSLHSPSSSPEGASSLSSCLEAEITKGAGVWAAKYEQEKVIRLGMADLIENYTCADVLLPTSKELRATHWKYTRPDSHSEPPRPVKVLFENAAAKVHVIQQFVSEEECGAVEEEAKKHLHQATVADDAGGSK